MITVKTPLWIWTGDGAGRWHFLTVPEEQAMEIKAASFANRRGFGSVPVEACIAGVSWRTSVFPMKDGGYLLPVKADVRKRTGIAAGDEVIVQLQV